MLSSSQKSTIYRNLPIGLSLCLGVVLAIALSIFVRKWEDANNQARFQQRISNLTIALDRSINRYTEVLYALRDFYNTLPKLVTRSQFNSFSQRAVFSYRGIQALEWVQLVKESEKRNFERNIHKSIDPNFRIYQQDQNGKPIAVEIRSEYFPVLYINPWIENEVALGYDLGSNQQRRVALEKSRESGEISATGRIKLVQEQKNQYGFLVFLAIYKNRQIPSNISIRNQELAGFVVGVFRVADVIEESLQGITTDIDFKISDQNPAEDLLGFYHSKTRSFLSHLVTANTQVESLCPDRLSCTRKIAVADRTWLVQFQPSESYTKGNKSWLSEATLLIGLVLTVGLTSYLHSAIAQLERRKELSELKLRLFSMASHEFRTPLSTILISAQTIENQDSGQNQKISQRIQSAVKRINQLLADLLTLSRAEAGKLEFTPEILDLEKFAIQLVEEIEHSLQFPRLINFLPILEDNPVFLDRKLMRSLILNLLDNALKYSHIETAVDFTLATDKTGIMIKVSDRGIGISLEDQTKIFQGFYRGQNVGEREGNGLGMAVIKTCVDLHGGKISLESKLGQGTTFTIILPRIE